MRYRSHVQRQIKGLLRADVHGDSGFYFGIETRSADLDLLLSGEQVHSGIEAVGVGSDDPHHACSNVRDHDLCLLNRTARSIGDYAGKGTSGNLRVGSS